MLPPSWKILKVSEEDGTIAICSTCSARVLEGKRLQFSHNKHPCPFVGTSEGLRKNYATDFRETWMEGGSGFKMDLSIFELDTSLYLTF